MKYVLAGFDLDKAMDYLIGDKLCNFVRTSDRSLDFAGELPTFVAEVKTLFTAADIRSYLDGLGRMRCFFHEPVSANFFCRQKSSNKVRVLMVCKEEYLIIPFGCYAFFFN
jgi:hypothetical protein